MDLYKQAGVDIDAGNEAAKRYAGLAKSTLRPEVLAAIGGFASGFALDLARFSEPVLVSGTDGVGTKLKIAFAAGRHDTVGIDCVAMCVNDILTVGAEPLFFLDYLAVGKLDVGVAEAVVSGVAEGCRQAGVALVGGETAEMPGMYGDGEYDLAGFAVGCVNRGEMVDGSAVRAGDVLLGLASNGVHSNGYSLVRKLVAEHNLQLTDRFPGEDADTAEVLLRPTRIYVKSVLKLLRGGVRVTAMAHITGGGIVDNLPRVLPKGCEAQIRRGSWPMQPVFQWLLGASGLSLEEASRIWNLGIGYVVALPEAEATRAAAILREEGEAVYEIGRIARGDGGVVFLD
ncbi:phosphoribosylformylglycinamidine cyclo-ligase [Alicyclobacillus vulcanalis]|uniref:Phosphoribosylformylglycinamidine cyclo-ligase n=1 Tax=Alicyclobacillus vulcanalis TaxID=252246 RepID=A0A1N7P5X4_9BACL|nr:phosphoribosylformylglycinamidine cyclo-ligase [Alicyclobacillus vulcanalis]SIT06035.1 phosphoribosylformylglycinamidine cyclo-ligase [Alicyclobacillus vulcanalis]